MRRVGIVTFLTACVFCASCSTIPIGRFSLADDIAEDHAALNDAYGRSVNGEILINILRSRDRWPRHYTDVSAISDTPSIVESGQLTVGPIPLNNPLNPFRASSAQLNRSLTTRPSYGVTPMTTEAIGRAIQSPTPRNVFEHYWNSGWQRDILLLVMVSSIRERAGLTSTSEVRQLEGHANVSAAVDANSGQNWSEPLYNSSEALARYCANDRQHDRCGFYRRVRALSEFEHRQLVNVEAPQRAECHRSDPVTISLANTALITSMSQAAAQSEANIEVTGNQVVLVQCEEARAEAIVLQYQHGAGSRSFLLELRSLDAMVYAMGELARFENGNVNLVGAPQCHRPSAAGAACPTLAPLFRVVEGDVPEDQDYAAIINHAGRRYLAGPRVADGHDHNGDRTATTLTLLTQLFAINHSPGALATIPRLIAD